MIGQTCDNIDFEPNPQAVQVINNHLTNNGAHPDPDSPVAGLAADLVWDNTGTGNCWGGNTPTATMKTLSGHPLPACP